MVNKFVLHKHRDVLKYVLRFLLSIIINKSAYWLSHSIFSSFFQKDNEREKNANNNQNKASSPCNDYIPKKTTHIDLSCCPSIVSGFCDITDDTIFSSVCCYFNIIIIAHQRRTSSNSSVRERTKPTYQLVNDELVVVYVLDDFEMMDWKVNYEYRPLEWLLKDLWRQSERSQDKIRRKNNNTNDFDD